MVEINVSEVVTRLRDLRNYSPELSKRMDYEEELPEDAVPFLVEKIETCYARCEIAMEANQADANSELARWLILSYRYYVARLARADSTWCFRFPSSVPHIHH